MYYLSNVSVQYKMQRFSIFDIIRLTLIGVNKAKTINNGRPKNGTV